MATAGRCIKVVDVTVNNEEQTVAKIEDTQELFIQRKNGVWNKFGVAIDPNREVDNIMRFYVYI